jgi:hypothetical protein
VSPLRFSRTLKTRVYAAGDEGRVVIDEADERRPPGVLPWQPEEEEARSLGDAATVNDGAVGCLG